MKKNEVPRINCRKCRHFFVTWENARPYGCKAHGFKTPRIPSLDVFTASGIRCLLFKRKLNQKKGVSNQSPRAGGKRGKYM